MPDWSKCSNIDCTIKKTCLRFMIQNDSIYQSYTIFKQNEDGTCDDFKPLKRTYADKQADC